MYSVQYHWPRFLKICPATVEIVYFMVRLGLYKTVSYTLLHFENQSHMISRPGYRMILPRLMYCKILPKSIL